MYRPHYGSFRTGGYQGRVPRAGSDSDFISRHAGTTEQQTTARMKHVARLLVDLIRDESDAWKSYSELINEANSLLEMIPDEARATSVAMQLRDVALHIAEQEKQHKALLERELSKLQEKIRVRDLAGDV